MRLYFEIARRAFQRITMYRVTLIAGMITNFFFGSVRSFVLLAVYGSTASVAGLTRQDAISYMWVTQAMISLGLAWVSWEMMATIRSGDVITDLTRPWSFYGYWLSRTLGGHAFNLLVRCPLTYLLGVLYFAARVPTLPDVLIFAVVLALALLIAFAYSFIANLAAFWLLDSTGVMLFANAVLSFFSGFLLPLQFFPPSILRIAQLLPFQAITHFPAEAFLGRLHGMDLIQALMLQLMWLVILTGLALLLLRSAVRKVVIQGG